VLIVKIVHAKAHVLNGVALSGRLKVRYWRAPTILWYSADSAMGVTAEAESIGDVSTGVVADLQAVMPALSIISAAYLACERCMLEESRVTVMPRKK
jgi:hypothetical protein